MDKRIIYKRPDGGVSVIIPADNALPAASESGAVEFRAKSLGLSSQQYLDQSREAGMTPEQFVATLFMTVEEIAAKDVPTGLPYKIVDVADIPSDRAARDLWDVDEADLTDGVGA